MYDNLTWPYSSNCLFSIHIKWVSVKQLQPDFIKYISKNMLYKYIWTEFRLTFIIGTLNQ